MRYSTISTAVPNSREIYINGCLFGKAPNPAMASSLTELLERLSRAEDNVRSDMVQDFLTGTCDSSKVQESLEELNATTKILRAVTTTFFVYTFLFAPIVLFVLDAYWLVLPVLSIGAIQLLSISILFALCHHRLYPEKRLERYVLSTQMLVYPPKAMKAIDSLCLAFLVRFNFTAVAIQLGLNAHCTERISQFIRDLKYPLPGWPDNDNVHAIEADSQHRLSLTRAILANLRKYGMRVRWSPIRCSSEEEWSKFCPRCLTTYRDDVAVCEDCNGLGLAQIRYAKNGHDDQTDIHEIDQS